MDNTMDKSSSDVSSTDSSTNSPSLKKQERLKKQQETIQNHKSHSTSDVSSIASSSRSSRSPWKDPTLDARPIADPALRKKLQSARGTRVTPREKRNSLPLVKSSDQKILEIMLKKREEEKKTMELSEKAKEKWETERERESVYRAQTASEKRRLLLEERRQKELQRTPSDVSSKRYSVGSMRKVHSASDATLNRSYDAEQKFGLQLQRKRSEENLRNLREDYLKNTDKTWESGSLRAMEAKQRQVEERRRQALERRKSVEKRLEDQRKEQEELNQLMSEKINTDLKRAQSMKESKEKEQLLRTKFRNYQAKKKTEGRINYLKQQSMEDINLLRVTLEEKHKTAEQKAEEEKKRKEEQLRRKEKGSDSKVRVSRENQKKIDGELETWRKDLLEYRKLQERKAENKAKQAVMEKKRKAAEERRMKEKLVKENMKKLNQQEDEWKADVEATIAMKDAKSKMLQMEKEDMIQESRALAHASQQLREELRQQYNSNDIDKLNRQTELEHRVLNKPMASLDINS